MLRAVALWWKYTVNYDRWDSAIGNVTVLRVGQTRKYG